MINFLIAAILDIVIIFISYFLFRRSLSGPFRHRMYEKMLSSFAKFVVLIFVVSLAITSLTALIFYRTRYVAYINVIAPALVSILVGFVVSLVPVKGVGDNKEKVIDEPKAD